MGGTVDTEANCVTLSGIAALSEWTLATNLPVGEKTLAVTDSYTTTEDIVLSVTAPGVLGNDNSVSEEPLTAVLDSPTVHGQLDLQDDGSFIYTPTLNFNGLDSFTYHAEEGQLSSNTVVVTLTVTAANDAPVAVTEAYTTTEDTSLSVAAPGILENDSDVDEDALTAMLDSDVSHGELTLEIDGSFVYTPTAGYFGQDLFSYYAYDGALASEVVEVILVVTEQEQWLLYLPLVIK